MSNILGSSENEIFSLRTLIVAPMIRSQVLVNVTPAGSVKGIVSYQGLVVDLPDNCDYDQTDLRQQYAKFEVVQSGTLNRDVGDTYCITLTDNSLDNELFAFIPRNIKNLQPAMFGAGEE